ncbi:MAG: MFS transporter [Burkholderiales bacterium]|nr:MFS transporter [Burkholderiales bacterium]
MALAQGSRSSFGLFVSPLNTATGLGLATISFAMAASQLAAGVAQPLFAAWSGRVGLARSITAGALLLALFTAMVPFVSSAAGLTFALSAGAAAAVAVGSAPTLLAAVAARVPAARRDLAAGIVGAGGSAGQLVLGPTTQLVAAASGWVNAIVALAALSAVAIPLALPFRRHGADAADAPSGRATRASTGDALRSRDFWLVSASFFVCGFHVSFLLAHMPGVIEACGLPPSLAGTWLGIVGVCNIIGSIGSGALIRRVSKRSALAVLYALRATGVALFLAAPKTETTMVAFSAWIGLTYMATLPPTSGLIADRFGVARLASLLGVTMLVHQAGSFLGVWLGGLAFARAGSYDWVWKADIALATLAAACVLAVREPAGRPAGPHPMPVGAGF